MRTTAILLLAVLVLSGCSAAGLQKAEQNTRLASFTGPLGEVVHLPIWVASEIAGASTDPEFVVEEREPWRSCLPGGISKEEYGALSDQEYLGLMAKLHKLRIDASRAARKAGEDPAAAYQNVCPPPVIEEEREPTAPVPPGDGQLDESATQANEEYAALDEVAKN